MCSINKIKEQLSINKRFWIAFTGDSITSCEWVHPNWRDIVIYVLQNELTPESLNEDWRTPSWGIRGFNFAYDGATTTDILNRIEDLLSVKPQLVISLMGGNDPVMGVDVKSSISNIQTIVNRVLKAGAELVWCNSTPAGKSSKKNEEYEPYAKALMQIPAKNGFLKIDMFNLFNKYPTEKFYTFISEENPFENIKAGEVDLQHPNQLGNAYIAKIVLREVFGIQFDPEKYMSQTLAGAKLPEY